MEKIIQAAFIATVAGLAVGIVLSAWDRWSLTEDAEYKDGMADAEAGRYMRRHSTIDYRRGYMHVCRTEHMHHWRTRT